MHCTTPFDLQFGYQCLQSVVDYSTVVKELQTKRMTSNLGPQKCRVLDVLTTLQSSILGFVPFECDMRNQLKKDIHNCHFLNKSALFSKWKSVPALTNFSTPL